MKSLIKNNPIISYLLITFVISWSFWFAPMIISVPKDIRLGIILIGGFGPAIAAFILLHICSGIKVKIKSKSLFWLFSIIALLILGLATFFVKRGNSETWSRNLWNGLDELSVLSGILLLASCFFWGLMMSNSKNTDLKENYLRSFLFDKTRIKWYMLAILFYPALYTLSYVLGNLFELETSEFFFNPDPYFILAFLLTFFFTGGPEEFGWRGFLQKELQKKYNPLITALFIGFVWALWHLPLHYNGLYPSDFTFLSRFLTHFQVAILFLWVYNKSGYSILVVMILHALTNNADRIFGASYIPAMVLGVILLIIFIFDNKMWKRKNYADEIYSNDFK
ncbi:hypothetical protein BH23BAC2_BH23BAC2_26370 [soil metagenome]